MTQPSQPGLRVRQSYLNLSDTQLAAFVQAIKATKLIPAAGRVTPPPATGGNISLYDWYVQLHVDAMRHRVHKSPWFPTWHRQYILSFENSVRNASRLPWFTLPYWDWAGDPANARGENSAVWGDKLMGGNGAKPPGPDKAGDVHDGPFQAGQWTLAVFDPSDPPPNNDQNLRRGFGELITPLPVQRDVDEVLSIQAYDADPYDDRSSYTMSFRNALEGWVTPAGHAPGVPVGMHNRAHRWVGGSMVSMASPNDPAFFLHHCNIDRLFAAWQDRNPAQQYAPPGSYPQPPATGEKIGGDDPMWPWSPPGTTTVTPNNVWDYKSLGYVYDTLWPVFTPPPTAPFQVRLTPVIAGPQWASDLFGNGWSLTQGNADSSTQAVSSSTPITAQGPWPGLSLLGSSLSGSAGWWVYLCLRGQGAPFQCPVLQRRGGPPLVFQTWTGAGFDDNSLGQLGMPAPVGPHRDYWFRFQPPLPPRVHPNDTWQFTVRPSGAASDYVKNGNMPLQAWGYLASA